MITLIQYTLDDAKELVNLLKGMIAHVNLIPINQIEDGKYIKSTKEKRRECMVTNDASMNSFKHKIFFN